jgi:hypothetical protein
MADKKSMDAYLPKQYAPKAESGVPISDRGHQELSLVKSHGQLPLVDPDFRLVERSGGKAAPPTAGDYFSICREFVQARRREAAPGD